LSVQTLRQNSSQQISVGRLTAISVAKSSSSSLFLLVYWPLDERMTESTDSLYRLILVNDETESTDSLYRLVCLSC
jgi:hypothetical protein